MPKLLEDMKKTLLQDPDKEEDPVPYDPESGTLTNIGRFLANNVAKDQGLAGMVPAAGIVREVGALAPKIAPALARSAPMLAEAALPAMKEVVPGSMQLGKNIWAPISKEIPLTIKQLKSRITNIQATNPDSREIDFLTSKLNTLQDMITRRNK